MAILNYLYLQAVPLISHNASFDMLWMIRDFNPDAKYFHEFRLFNYVGCTYVLYRHLASEGFFGQRWGLDYAQRTLLNIESNKIERNKKLVEQGLLKKHIARGTLLKLCGSEEAMEEYMSTSSLHIEACDEEQEVSDATELGCT